jgi:predicted phosphohydrolase
MQFDLISDIHIDRWDTCFHVSWEKTQQSDICVIAGDIADNLDMAIAELKYIASVYKTVVYIEGNHEHQHYWPNFSFAPNYLRTAIAAMPNVLYLYDDYKIINDVAFLGKCGWWNFKFAEPVITEQVARNRFIKDKFDICDEITNQSDSEFYYLFGQIHKLQFEENINSIVVVTHTAPLPKFTSPGEYPPWPEYSAFQGNSNMYSILNVDFKEKIKTWVFGHNHDAKDDIVKHVRFVSNPRGRPTDYNREIYLPKVIQI